MVENFECLVKALDKYKRIGKLSSNRKKSIIAQLGNVSCFMWCLDNFITDCVLYAAPSTEKFKVDMSKYTNVDTPSKTPPNEKLQKVAEKEQQEAEVAANA